MAFVYLGKNIILMLYLHVDSDNSRGHEICAPLHPAHSIIVDIPLVFTQNVLERAPMKAAHKVIVI